MSLEHKINTNFIDKAVSLLRKYAGIAALGIGMSMFAYGCASEQEGCQYDTQCTQERICVEGECVYSPEKKDVVSTEEVFLDNENGYDASETSLEWVPGTCACENNIVKKKGSVDGTFDFEQYCGTGGKCDVDNCKCAPLNCSYKCDVTETFEFYAEGVGYSAHECANWNESICSPGNGGILLDNNESVSVEMKASAKAQFLKITILGKTFPEKYYYEDSYYGDPPSEPLEITLDGLPIYIYKLNEKDSCNPIILSTFDLLDLATNLKITYDEKVKVNLSLGSPKIDGSNCQNYGYNPYYCSPEHKDYSKVHYCGEKNPCSEGKFMNPEMGCKYSITRLVLTSCFYCNPETDPTCTQCAPIDPFCSCK